MFETILVPVDGSDGAARALDAAIHLARQNDASVHVLSVVDVRYLSASTEIQTEEAAATERLADFVDRFGDVDVSLTTTVRHGIPEEEILDYADEIDADLLAMGTHGRTGVSRYVLGSVTEKVVRLSDIPVLTVQLDGDVETVDPISFENILVPTDGSAGARAAAGPAGSIAAASDATVHVISVVDTRSMGVDVRSDLILGELEKVARDAVGTLESELTEHGASSTQTSLVHGIPYQAIREFIDEKDIDLVVMGTHGRTGIERYLLGSVTEKVVRTSPVPVLTVREPEADAEDTAD